MTAGEPPAKMHADEVHIDADLVRELVASQFPQLSHLPLRPLRSTGTVNAIYRVGDGRYARLPRLEEWADGVDREWDWLPRLAPRLSLQVPEPIALGRPTDSYPLTWAIFRWIEGRPYADDLVADEADAARDLARFVTELRAVEHDGAPPTGRRPLRELDQMTREAIASAGPAIDGPAVAAAWDRALDAPVWHGAPTWIHTDLLRPNLLVDRGRLRAVLDFGAVGIGDPAGDVIAAWSVFGARGRAVYREALDVDDGTWERARGIALHQAVAIVPYYRETNPGFVTLAQRTVREVLADD